MSSSNQQPTFETSFTNDVKWNTTTTSAAANTKTTTTTTTTSNDDHSKQNSQNQHQNQYQSNKNINNFDPLSSSSSVGQIDDGHLTNNSSNAINSTSASASASASTNNQDQTSPEDLSLFISDLLEQMQTKFENMGTTIVNRIDDMGSRIDTLEKSIGDLMEQSGLSEPTYGSAGNSIKQSTDHSDE